MLAFIIPLKPRSQSKNWEKDVILLKRTIACLLRQTSDDYRIYVVFSDSPELSDETGKVIFIQSSLAFASVKDIPEANKIMHYFNNDAVMFERRWDKSRKIFLGCKAAKEDGCEFLMSVDADDLLSNRLVKYVQQESAGKMHPGFYIDKGYLYYEGKKKLIKVNGGMQNLNGSTHIINSDHVDIPDLEHAKWENINLFTSHGWIVYRLKEERGVSLTPVEFPAVIYVSHGGNISAIGSLHLKKRVKNFFKTIIRGKKITKEIRDEFSLNHL